LTAASASDPVGHQVSVLSGVQFGNMQSGQRKVMFLFEYFDGPSPDGPFFFTRRLQWF